MLFYNGLNPPQDNQEPEYIPWRFRTVLKDCLKLLVDITFNQPCQLTSSIKIVEDGIHILYRSRSILWDLEACQDSEEKIINTVRTATFADNFSICSALTLYIFLSYLYLLISWKGVQ